MQKKSAKSLTFVRKLILSIKVALTILPLCIASAAMAQISNQELRCKDEKGNSYVTLQETCEAEDQAQKNLTARGSDITTKSGSDTTTKNGSDTATKNGSDTATKNCAAYRFGKLIQKFVKNRDLPGLFSLVDGELQYWPKKSFILSRQFEDIFDEKWIKAVLEMEPMCSPIGWKGYTLQFTSDGEIRGEGGFWYNMDGDRGSVFSILGGYNKVFPSYDCRKAKETAEVLICDDVALAKLDTGVADIYHEAERFLTGSSGKFLRQSQLDYLNERNKCFTDIKCIKKAMSIRSQHLKQELNSEIDKPNLRFSNDDVLKKFEGTWKIDHWVNVRNCMQGTFSEFVDSVKLKISYRGRHVEIISNSANNSYYEDDDYYNMKNILEKKCEVKNIKFSTYSKLYNTYKDRHIGGTCGDDIDQMPYKPYYIFLGLESSETESKSKNTDCGSLVFSFDDNGRTTVVRGLYSNPVVDDFDGWGIFVHEGWLMQRAQGN